MLRKLSLILIAVLMLAACEEETVKPNPPVLDCEILGTLYENHSVKLSLDNMNLGLLPDCIGNLTSLKELYLANNQLTTLPESIGNLSDLEYLWLFGNQLTTLPESIGNLTDLITLGFSSNQLTEIP
jgi:internalin A